MPDQINMGLKAPGRKSHIKEWLLVPDQINFGSIDITIKAKKEKGSDKGFEQSQPPLM